MKKLLRFAGVALLALTIGVFGLTMTMPRRSRRR